MAGLLGRTSELAEAQRLLDERAGVVLFGEAGIGKTQLARALADGQTDAAVVAVRATPSMREVPLGAFALVRPAVEDGSSSPAPADIAAFTTRLRQDLLALADGRPLILWVDDAHHLDATSTNLVYQFAASGLARVIATVRTGEDAPELVHALWKEEHCGRIDVDPLDLAGTTALAEQLVDGQLEQDSAAALHAVTRGNPLFTRELVRAALGSGALDQRMGLWFWAGTVGEAPRLRDLVASQLGALSATSQALVQILALTDQLPLAVVDVLVTPAELAALEDRSVVGVDHDPTPVVHLGHPIVGEVLRPAPGSAVARVRLREVVDAWNGIAASEADGLRLATWRLDIDDPIDPAELVATADLAHRRCAPGLAERAARRALADLAERPAGAPEDAGPLDARAGAVLGDVLIQLGRHAEADAVLRDLCSRTDLPDALLARLLSARLRTLAHGLASLDIAEAEVVPRLDEVIDPTWRSFLQAQWATVLARHARLDEARLLTDELRDADDDLVRLRALPAINMVEALSGRVETGYHLALSLIGTALARRDEIADGPGWVAGALYLDTTLAGHLDDTDAMLRISESDPMLDLPANRANHSMSLGRVALQRGKARTAARLSREAVSGFDRADEQGWRSMAVGLFVEAHAHLGDHDAIVDFEHDLDGAVDTTSDPLFRIEAARGMCWHHLAAGDVTRAITSLTELADDAVDQGVPALAALCRHDAVRLGAGARVAAALATLVADFEGPRFAAIGLHATGRAQQDPAALEGAGDAFAAIGMLLVAAECLADASRLHRRNGSLDAARRTARRAAELHDACEGARTPSLAQPLEIDPLTTRELEVARLAGAGMTSRDIAERLSLSVRTVEGHLGRAYDKLGVRSRAELADAVR